VSGVIEADMLIRLDRRAAKRYVAGPRPGAGTRCGGAGSPHRAGFVANAGS